eukprot:GFUD01009189.1.p1 GENE.GFUD01009189.1~~GFUD01009189.1.p1  ORF type:complete len:201 (+),score=23.34 GFUD01009189.1:74-604(+)
MVATNARRPSKPSKPSVPTDPADMVCYYCILANAPMCLSVCKVPEYFPCFNCLAINAPQCLRPCGFPSVEDQNSKAGVRQNHCRPIQPLCSVSQGLRIKDQPYKLKVVKSIAPISECETECSNDNLCTMWTLNQLSLQCYLVNYNGDCLQTMSVVNWASGRTRNCPEKESNTETTE